MKTTKLTYEAVFNIGNYQTLRLGGEYTLEKDEKEQDAYIAIDRQLRESAKQIIADRIKETEAAKEEEKIERKKIADTDTDKINSIGTLLAKRVADGMSVEAVMANVDKYYEVSDKVRKVWEEAVKFQSKI